MIVPSFWAEAHATLRQPGRQSTLRRFGWSDVSQADAQRMAEARVQQALDLARSGQKLPRRERKVAYNGADGLPIREEILERHGDCVITRNSYGARCLNTPGVLFADIDFDRRHYWPLARWIMLLCFVSALVAAFRFASATPVVLMFLAPLLAYPLARLGYEGYERWQGGAEALACQRVFGFVDRHPDWHCRLYRTPAGLRVVVTHRRFSPAETEVEEFFRRVQVDPVYASMCRRQSCFRARLSAKPWRIGIETHLSPRPGVWPVSADRLPARIAWVARYEAKSQGFAACQKMEDYGSGMIHRDVAPTLHLHDQLARALTGLPLA
jgi:hypothetical protein